MPPRPAVFEVPDLGYRHYTGVFQPRISLVPAVYYKIFTFFRHFRRSYNLLLRNLDFEDGAEWQPVRPLGEGSFGAVALWHKKDPNGSVIDEIALKEVGRCVTEDAIPLYEKDPKNLTGLAHEAVLQTQLSESRSQNTVHLRGYKFYRGVWTLDSVAFTGRYRFYFEFLPHGSLHTLLARYRAWDQHLPEHFVWHVFHSLALALCTLFENPRVDWYTKKKLRKNWGIVHLDLKPANVCLGYPEENESGEIALGIPEYPSVKLSDFGLSEVTGPGDPDNPSLLFDTCTATYRPPEHYGWYEYNADSKKILSLNIYGNTFDDPPNGIRICRARNKAPSERDRQRYQANPGFQFDSSHNIWSAAKTVHDLMILDRSTIAWLNQRTMDEQGYHRLGNHATPPIDFPDKSGRQIYSEELRTLVWECMRPNKKLRPTPYQLRERTRAGLDLARSKLAEQISQNSSEQSSESLPGKVFYARNEINQMPRGEHRFPPSPGDWNSVMQHEYMDPDWGSLIPPPQKWGYPGRPQTFPIDRDTQRPFRGNSGEWIEIRDGKLIVMDHAELRYRSPERITPSYSPIDDHDNNDGSGGNNGGGGGNGNPRRHPTQAPRVVDNNLYDPDAQSRFDEAFPYGFQRTSSRTGGLLSGLLAVVASMRAVAVREHYQCPTLTELHAIQILPEFRQQVRDEGLQDKILEQIAAILYRWGRDRIYNLQLGYTGVGIGVQLLQHPNDQPTQVVWIWMNQVSLDRAEPAFEGLEPLPRPNTWANAGSALASQERTVSERQTSGGRDRSTHPQRRRGRSKQTAEKQDKPNNTQVEVKIQETSSSREIKKSRKRPSPDVTAEPGRARKRGKAASG